jgi:hypothetical protein
MKRFSFLALALVFCFASIAEAQQKPGENKYIGGGYRPTRPTLSPYLNYFRQDTGVTDQYRSFIRPQQRLQRRFSMDQYQNRTLGNRIGQVDKEVQGVQKDILQFRQPTVSPTGKGATFMNYSHYFSSGGGAARR